MIIVVDVLVVIVSGDLCRVLIVIRLLLFFFFFVKPVRSKAYYYVHLFFWKFMLGFKGDLQRASLVGSRADVGRRVLGVVRDDVLVFCHTSAAHAVLKIIHFLSLLVINNVHKCSLKPPF